MRPMETDGKEKLEINRFTAAGPQICDPDATPGQLLQYHAESKRSYKGSTLRLPTSHPYSVTNNMENGVGQVNGQGDSAVAIVTGR